MNEEITISKTPVEGVDIHEEIIPPVQVDDSIHELDDTLLSVSQGIGLFSSLGLALLRFLKFLRNF